MEAGSAHYVASKLGELGDNANLPVEETISTR